MEKVNHPIAEFVQANGFGGVDINTSVVLLRRYIVIERGDPRSQFFADQDWSDEANHVRYGKRWIAYLLEDDLRSEEDILAEVRKHMERVTGIKQDAIAAPF